MPKTPPNDGTELETILQKLLNDNERINLQNQRASINAYMRDKAITERGVVMHGDVESWLNCTNEAYGIPVGILVNAIIRHHMWLDVDTGEMRNDLGGMMWWPNETEY